MKIKIFTLMLIAIIYSGIAPGQNLNAGISLNSIISGAGLGTSLSPQITLSTKRHFLASGINIQDHHCNFSGFRVRYEFTVNPLNNKQLFFFYDFASHSKAFLSKLTTRQESNMSPEFAGYFNKARIKTIEQHIGFGLNIRVFEWLKAFGAVGTGFYQTIQCYEQGLYKYRQKDDFSLMLMAGLKLKIIKIR